MVVVDTNVLLAATDRSRAHHGGATRFLGQDERDLAITPQVAREYLAVATRPVEANGLGLAEVDAVANLRDLLDVLALLEEGSRSTAVLLGLLTEVGASGRQVHDANVVAVALAHGAAAVVTEDTRHFTRFAHRIALEDLSGWTT